jgi:hypothetical protein
MMCSFFSESAHSFSLFKKEKETTEVDIDSKNHDDKKSGAKKKDEDEKEKDKEKDKKSSPVVDKSKAVVVFKDGTVVTEDEIKTDIDKIPDQIANKMSLSEIKNIIAWRKAFNLVIDKETNKIGFMNDPVVKKVIEARLETAIGLLFLDDLSMKEMTFEKAKAHYDSMWDKHFKNSKEFTLLAITTSDPSLVSRLKQGKFTEQKLKQLLDSNAATTKYMDMEARPQGTLPPEINDAVSAAKIGSIVGPFEVRGSFMLFFIKNVGPARKEEFTPLFFEHYKETARRDFVSQCLEGLYKKYEVKTFDINGNLVNVFLIGDNDKLKKSNNKPLDLSKAKDDAVLAVVGKDKKQITVSDLKKYFKVESLLDEQLLVMAQQFNIKIEDVIKHATKILTDDEVLSRESKATGYANTPEAKGKIAEVRNMEIGQQFMVKMAKATPEMVKLEFNKFIQAIPDEDKNDNEIAVKILLFQTQAEAARTLQSISSGAEKFNNLFNSSKGTGRAVDLGYIKKKGTPPELWSAIKKGPSGACCREVIEINGAQFGVGGTRFAVVYVADRRPMVLPSLSNPQDKKYFQAMAERAKAIELARKLIGEYVESIYNKPLSVWLKNEEYVNRVFAMIIGTPG